MKSRMLVSLLVIALAAAVIGGGTMAWFTDEATGEPASFTAGTLMIDIDNPELTGTYDVVLDRLNPGDCVEWEFDVRNVGNKSANWLLYMCYRDTVGQDNDDLCADQPGLLGARDYGTDPLSDVMLWTIKIDGDTVYEGVLGEAPLVLGEELAFAAPEDCDDEVSVTVTVTACLPVEAGNEYQGGKTELYFGAKAWQTTNGAPAPDIDDIECIWENGDDNGEDCY
ncbi:MAG: hypothetical protein GX825_02405 [Syntrophomonadaceae bacterium]|nr:hypothetical protein [Syntrophomonadaceae bacterium]